MSLKRSSASRTALTTSSVTCATASLGESCPFPPTPRPSGDSHAYFDRGLGCEVKSSQHKDKLLKERDLVPVSDMGNGYVESRMTNSVNEAKAHDKTVSKYNDNVKKFDGDQGRAIAETFPAHEIL